MVDVYFYKIYRIINNALVLLKYFNNSVLNTPKKQFFSGYFTTHDLYYTIFTKTIDKVYKNDDEYDL